MLVGIRLFGRRTQLIGVSNKGGMRTRRAVGTWLLAARAIDVNEMVEPECRGGTVEGSPLPNRFRLVTNESAIVRKPSPATDKSLKLKKMFGETCAMIPTASKV